MEIILNDKTYIAPAPKAKMVRKAIGMTETTRFQEMKTADLDNLVSFVVELFGQQFSLEDVYDGLEAKKLLPIIMDCLNTVVGTVGAKLEQFPKNEVAGA